VAIELKLVAIELKLVAIELKLVAIELRLGAKLLTDPVATAPGTDSLGSVE